MTLQKFLTALVDSAFDRIDSSVPPCVDKEESMSQSMTQYRHGIIETVASTFQTLTGTEHCWTMQDMMTVSGFHKAVEDFCEARTNDDKARHTPANVIVNRLLAHQGIELTG